MNDAFDFVVLGAGSAGVRAARFAAGFGAKVAIVEAGALGGTCVNVGCIPKKLYVYASEFPADVHDAAFYGWDVSEPTMNFRRLVENKDREIARLNGIYQGFSSAPASQSFPALESSSMKSASRWTDACFTQNTSSSPPVGVRRGSIFPGASSASIPMVFSR